MQMINTNDRLGGNLMSYFAILCICHKNNWYIPKIHSDRFQNSIYVKILNELIDKLNSEDIQNKKQGKIDFLPNHNYLCWISMKACLELKQDLYSYIKENFSCFFREKLSNVFTLPSKEYVAAHLRLDDTNWSNRIDFDGKISSSYFINKINNNNLKISFSEEIEHLKTLGVEKDFNLYNAQGPVKDFKVENILKKYKDKDIFIVASPIGDLTLKNYKTIRTDNPDYDLYVLINSNILICSRSVYTTVGSFFHLGSKVYYPIWGHSASTGMNTIYDKSNIGYYY